MKVQVDSAGIAVLNDQESLLRQAKEAERRQKEEAREKKLREEDPMLRVGDDNYSDTGGPRVSPFGDQQGGLTCNGDWGRARLLYGINDNK